MAQIKGLSKTDSDMLQDMNRVTIDKMLAVAKKSVSHCWILEDYYINQLHLQPKGTIGFELIEEYLKALTKYRKEQKDLNRRQ